MSYFIKLEKFTEDEYKTKKIFPPKEQIFRAFELVDDMACKNPSSPDLTHWAKEGVLLINSVLSVEMAKANSHQGKGWEEFTDFVIQKLSIEYKHIVFVLWGNDSKKKEGLIDSSKPF